MVAGSGAAIATNADAKNAIKIAETIFLLIGLLFSQVRGMVKTGVCLIGLLVVEISCPIAEKF
jgi:hypothetical protein